MRQIIWTCDKCGYKEEVDEDYLPENWIHDLRKNKVYHNQTCMMSDMTLEELEKYNSAVWMA